MLNIVLPMAGRGSRFSKAGYTIPKPFIPIHGVPMIKVVIDNLTPRCEHRFIFICQKKYLETYDVERRLRSYTRNPVIIAIDGITEGQVCTALCARSFFNNDDPLMSANTDQYIDIDINEYLDAMFSRNLDGMIMTMKSTDPKWSYARTDAQGLVVETAEKKVISEDATVGIFNFAHGSDLVRSAEKMIADNIRINGEFYTCPCYNYLIKEGKRIGIYPIGKEYSGMYGLGIPEDLEFFISHPISQKVIR
ncbi:glycosyltransferase family 2 protein [uncultured Mailhella sp.]|uniref:glycosyltransferase family 2 protein n=1 Tax=uncultured Mailhella sp. TaxID=1981031 RepID=UPI0025D74BE9|nr:glycosyltransferase family 2 protein [uncultured Mailhella sp.]